MAIEYRDIVLYGGLGEFHDLLLSGECPREVLVEGPAGTGKSFGICCDLVMLCEMYPNIRVLIARKTRASMSESILTTLEKFAFPPNHPALSKGGQITHRRNYQFPNGSRIIVQGFDDPERIKSTEYDVVYVNECTELTLTDWEIALTRLRNNELPLGHIAIADCNPDAPTHWLNRRAAEGGMKRIQTIHEDNPALVDPESGNYTEYGSEYMAGLDATTGVRYQRLRLGLWVSAEGAIWPNFQPDIHVIDSVPLDQFGDPVTDWFFGSVDWGKRDAGVFHVYGVDRYKNLYLVHETYRVDKDIDWWSEKAVQLDKTYGLRSIVCDPSRSDHISYMNRCMARNHGGDRRVRKDKNWCIGAKNDIAVGLSVVSERLDNKKLFFLRNALEYRDSELEAAHKPCGVIEEIPSYEYRQIKDGQPVKEEPRPDGEDHGCDTLRYACMYLDGSNFQPKPPAEVAKTGTYADWLDMDETMAAIERGEYL